MIRYYTSLIKNKNKNSKFIYIKYDINIKNKKTNRNNRIKYLGLEDNLDLLNQSIKGRRNFFDTTTFKIITIKFFPYKLFIITGIPRLFKIPKILVIIKILIICMKI